MTHNTINDAVTMAGGEGTLLAGRYRVVRQLGQGGMGSVWLAEDSQLDGKLFAIKMLPSILVSNKRAYRQLKDEALVAMKLTHSNIVTLRAFEENNGNPFLVMDYIDGQTLDDYLAERGALDEEEAIKLLRPIASALDYAHAKGVVHRDVKPGNVMIAKDGTPFILDFGIAREIQETMTRVTGKLSSGTLLYMSPEQLNGEPPKAAQDIYSFAAMVYECLKGEPPFVRGAIEDQIKSKTPESLGPHIIISGLVAQGLAKKPEDRPATCLGVIEGDGFNTEAQRRRGTEARGGGVSRWLTIVIALATIAVAGVAYWRLAGDKTKSETAHETQSTNGTPPTATSPEDSTGGDKTNKTDVANGSTNVTAAVVSTNSTPMAETPVGPQGGYVTTPARPPHAPASGPAKEQRPKPKPQPEPPKPDPEFVKMTNILGEAVMERNLEYGKANPFKRSPRGFENRLKRIDDMSNQWTKIEVTYAPNEIKMVRKALDALKKETEKLREEINWMSDNEANRGAAVKKECEFNKFYDVKMRDNADIFARAEKRNKWKSVQGEIEAAKSSVDNGLFDKAVKLYSELEHEITRIFNEERDKFNDEVKREAEEKFLCSLRMKGFIQDDKSNKYQPGTEKSISLPGGKNLVLVWCPPGWFMMGSAKTDEVRHAVRLTKGFWIGKYEVTEGEYKAVMGLLPERQSAVGDAPIDRLARGIVSLFSNNDNKPVTDVSYEDCERFCEKLSELHGKDVKLEAGLPTEAEWEYACRAGTTGDYSIGSIGNAKTIKKDMANVDASTLDEVGQYKEYANRWGVCDMHGNVREWCRDVHKSYANVDSLSEDPVVNGDGNHVVRGGACNEDPDRCRCAARNGGAPNRYTGFRIRCYNLP